MASLLYWQFTNPERIGSDIPFVSGEPSILQAIGVDKREYLGLGLRAGIRYDIESTIHLEVRREGPKRRFWFGNTDPIAEKPTGEALSQWFPKETQLFPLDCKTDRTWAGYVAVNFCTQVDCIDMKSSSPVRHPVVPSCYIAFKTMTIDQSRVPRECNLFRLTKMLPYVVVSEEGRLRFISAGFEDDWFRELAVR